MYLRTTKRRHQDGTEVAYVQLAHNVRHLRSGKPVAQLSHSFGRADQVDRDSLVCLGRSLARFGAGMTAPKNGAWSPQVVIALAVTRDGLPVRSWVFPGQTAAASTEARIKADLRDWNLGRALLLADAGGTDLLATRLGRQTEVKGEVLARPGRFKIIAANLQAKEVVVGEGERRPAGHRALLPHPEGHPDQIDVKVSLAAVPDRGSHQDLRPGPPAGPGGRTAVPAPLEADPRGPGHPPGHRVHDPQWSILAAL